MKYKTQNENEAGDTSIFSSGPLIFGAIICVLLVFSYIIAVCTAPVGVDQDKPCGHKLHIHLKQNRSIVKKINNRCEHVDECRGKRVRNLKNISYKRLGGKK